MRRNVFVLATVVALIGVVSYLVPASGQSDGAAAPIFGGKILPGYRDWRLISVAHEAGDLNDLRAILGNGAAINAYREGKLPFPDGTIIARLAWSYVPSEENDEVFGGPQSFVAGPPKEGVQFMVKDSSKYASTGGRGSLNLSTANLSPRRSSRAAFLATNRPKIATLFSPVTRLEARVRAGSVTRTHWPRPARSDWRD
jgi:hypothetical protein